MSLLRSNFIEYIHRCQVPARFSSQLKKSHFYTKFANFMKNFLGWFVWSLENDVFYQKFVRIWPEKLAWTWHHWEDLGTRPFLSLCSIHGIFRSDKIRQVVVFTECFQTHQLIAREFYIFVIAIASFSISDSLLAVWIAPGMEPVLLSGLLALFDTFGNILWRRQLASSSLIRVFCIYVLYETPAVDIESVGRRSVLLDVGV